MGKMWIVLTLKILWSFVIIIDTSPVIQSNTKCENLIIPFCQQLGYNETIFPNLMTHEKQEDAGLEVYQYTPLVKVNCSPDLKMFLCSVYAPVCVDATDAPTPPCRRLCESAKQNCDSMMMQYGFSWPERLECLKFPDASDAAGTCFNGFNRPKEDLTPETGVSKSSNKCEKLTIPFCQQLGYNETIFPNLMTHEKQEDAGPELHQYTPLVNANCSPDLKMFLCSVYAPVCVDASDAPMPPCRRLCESAKQNCDKMMMQYGFSWPERLECSKFPDASDAAGTCFNGFNRPKENLFTVSEDKINV